MSPSAIVLIAALRSHSSTANSIAAVLSLSHHSTTTIALVTTIAFVTTIALVTTITLVTTVITIVKLVILSI
jgi:hypothetical protein